MDSSSELQFVTVVLRSSDPTDFRLVFWPLLLSMLRSSEVRAAGYQPAEV